MLALKFASVLPVSAICTNPDGSVEISPDVDKVYSRNNGDGRCSDCDYTCSIPIESQGWY